MPAGLYNDQGAKALREMLFDGGEVHALFGLSNERYLFEEVHHSVKFCILVFGKGGKTREFEAAFRINPCEAVAADQLDVFLRNEHLHLKLTPELIRQLSPTTVSIMEFRDKTDIEIAEKLMRFPALEKESSAGWQLVLCNELHMTNDSDLFKTQPGSNRLPLYEGKMMNQYRNLVAEPKYWVDETDATVLPRRVFCPHSVSLEKLGMLDAWSRFYLLALLNSFCVDYLLRQRVNNNLSFFTGPKFDDLAREVGLSGHTDGATDFATRARLRAEIDGLVAHLYDLTEVEFRHVLATFPVVPDPHKVAAHNAYRERRVQSSAVAIESGWSQMAQTWPNTFSN